VVIKGVGLTAVGRASEITNANKGEIMVSTAPTSGSGNNSSGDKKERGDAVNGAAM